MIFPLWEGAFAFSGDLAVLHFKITSPDSGSDERLYSFLSETSHDYSNEFADAIAQVLGRDIELRRVGVRKGSVEVLVVIGATYVLISRYKNFTESVRSLVSQMGEVLRKYCARAQVPGISVEGSWAPSADLVGAQAMLSGRGATSASSVLLWYVIASHAVLLVLFAWLVVRTVLLK